MREKLLVGLEAAKSLDFKKIGTAMLGRAKRGQQAALNFYSGPLSNSAMVGKEFIRIVAKEQKMYRPPSPQEWQAAKETYLSWWSKVKDEGKLGLSLVSMARRIGDLSWSQAARGGRVAVELSAYYYIGNLLGQTVGTPLTIFRRH